MGTFDDERTDDFLSSAIEPLRAELLVGINHQLDLLSRSRFVAASQPEGRSTDLWWWIDEDERIFLKVFFRGRPLPVRAGKDTAVLARLDEVVAALQAVRLAVLAGELDQQLRTHARS